jgi:Protein of unknown function (DUF3828)
MRASLFARLHTSLFMRTRGALVALFVLTLAAPTLAQAGAAPAAKPDAVIREFYKWYVHALNQNKDPLTGQRTVMRKYVTTRLIREIDRMAKGPDGLDGDYFIDAQDWDKEWEKNIDVSDIVTKVTIATARVTLSGPQMTRHVQVTLKQEAGVWKVDRVKGLDN